MNDEDDVMKDLEDLDKEVTKPKPKPRRRAATKPVEKDDDSAAEKKPPARRTRSTTKKVVVEEKVEAEEEPIVEETVVEVPVKTPPDVRSGLESAALPEAVKEAVEAAELPPVWVPEERTQDKVTSKKSPTSKATPMSRREKSLASRYNRRRR